MRLEAVSKRYGLRQPWVVRNVTREVAAGRLIRLEGPNGSGKSTLLRVLAGVTRPTAGRVTGRPHTGYVPERSPAVSASPPGIPAASRPDPRLSGSARAEQRLSVLAPLSAGTGARSKGMSRGRDRPARQTTRPGADGVDRSTPMAAERVPRVPCLVDHDRSRSGTSGRSPSATSSQRGTALVQAARAGRGLGVGGPGSGGETLAAVVIELTGLESGSLARLAQTEGVLAVAADSAARCPTTSQAGNWGWSR